MVNSVTDTSEGLTQIRTKVSSCVSEVDFEHSLMEAVSVDEDKESSGEIVSGKMTLSQIFEAASEKYDVPLELLKAVAKQESDFHIRSVSHAGAQGIMQLMPSTARSLGVTDSFDAWQNIMGGAKYLSQKLAMYNGDVRLALAAYNAGSGNVSKYGGIPPFAETRDYIKKVLSYMKQDVDIPEQTVEVSPLSSGSNAVKRQAHSNKMELKVEDGEEVSPVQKMLSVTPTKLSETISEKMQLYLQEQSRTSVSVLIGKLLKAEVSAEDKE